MFGKSVIEREVREMERVRERPFSPSTKKVILASDKDPRELIQKRIRKLRSKKSPRDVARSEFFEHVLEAVDFARYHALQKELLAAESLRAHSWRIKYLNLDYWLGAKLDIALDLGLHESAPLKILDIGVGPGHFPFICRVLGHQVVGTDIADLPLDASWQGRHIFDGLIDVLEVDRRGHAVERGVPLPDFGGPFDLVTALMVKFDNPIGAPVWVPADWRFFLDDLSANVLAPGGRLYLKLNRPFAGDEIMTFMEEAGGKTDRPQCVVLFERLTAAVAAPPA